jgi:hypothetical protein
MIEEIEHNLLSYFQDIKESIYFKDYSQALIYVKVLEAYIKNLKNKKKELK